MADAKTKQKQSEATEEREEKNQRYELVYLIANKFSEDEVGPIMADIAGLLKKNGAQIVKEENWGKRRLAYPIGQYRHAYYAFLEFDMPTEGTRDVEHNLRLDERIMRHLIVKTHIKTAAEIEAERRAANALTQETEEAKEETETESKQPANSEKKKKEDTGNERKSDAGKVSMEQLDEKLNKIVDDAGKLV